jgi:hypothetical protein
MHSGIGYVTPMDKLLATSTQPSERGIGKSTS